MAKPKFPLRMDDGSEVRTLEELREHADLATIAARYDDGTLRRWLGCWNFIEEAAKVEQLDSEAEGFHKALYNVLGIPWTEETDAQLTAYADAEIERELAAQRKCEAQEAQAEPEVEMPEPGNALARSSMDDAMCDEVARLLNYRSDKFEFVEMDDYVFFSSESSGKDGKWVVFSKGKSEIVEFVPLGDESKLLLEPVRTANSLFSSVNRLIRTFSEGMFTDLMSDEGKLRSSRYMRACGNQVAIDNRQGTLSLLDMEMWKVKPLQKKGEEYRRSLSNAVCKRLVCIESDLGYTESKGLWVYSLKDGTRAEITAHRNSIKASHAFLTENAVFFLCEKSEGWLDDGKNPNGCICRYDMDTGKSMVLANLEISNFHLSHIGISGDRLHICGRGGGDYYYCDISADVPTKTIHLRRILDDLCAEHYLEGSEKFCGEGLFSFQDGFVFLCGSERKLYLCFLDFATGGKQFFLLADTAERVSRIGASTWFRLGNWLYYSLKADSDTNAPRERWKISLETGEQVKLSCGN